ncbi:MAG: hypothetical protein Q8O86_09365 [Dehalococcoidia bacterium]|nr:hypothetical protein [Dehalococcoidia bacterium]
MSPNLKAFTCGRPWARVDGLSEALRAVRQGPEELPAALTRLWQVTCKRLEAMTEAERQQTVRPAR